MPDVLVTLPLAEVRPDLPLTLAGFKSVLDRLSRTDTLFHCSRLNTAVSKTMPADSFLDMQRRALAILDLSADTKRKIEGFGQTHGGAARVSVVSRGALLELIRWAALFCQDQPGDGETFLEQDRREALLLALLYAGEIWVERIYRNIGAAVGLGPSVEAHRLALLRRAFLETAPAPSLPATYGRGWELFHDGMRVVLPEFEDWFREGTGLSLQEHYAITVSLDQMCQGTVKSMPKGTRGNVGVFDVRTFGNVTRLQDKFRVYLRFRTASAESLATGLWREVPLGENPFEKPPDYPLGLLRSRPFFVSHDGRGIVMDPICFRNLALGGVLFSVPGRHRATVLQRFGDAFQQYAQTLLRRLYPRSPLLVDQLFLNEKVPAAGTDAGEIDAAVVQGKEAILFEFKAAWLRDDALAVDRELEWLDGFDSRYAAANKGTGQLATLLKALGALHRSAWPPFLKDVETFFPVLATYDSQMHGAFGKHLLTRFSQQLGVNVGNWQPYPEVGIAAQFRVAPLCVLSIEELELLEEIAKRASLLEVVREYAVSDVDARGTLDEFLSAHSRLRELRRHNQHLVSVGSCALDSSGELLFGRDWTRR